VTAGAGVTLMKTMGIELFLGGQGTLNPMDSDLEPYYGEWPLSWEVFLKLRPAAMKMGSKQEHSFFAH